MTTVAYCSDLHLEFNDVPEKFPVADYLLVAGDFTVAKYLQSHRTDHESYKMRKKVDKFLERTAHYKGVYFISGNHEHYSGEISESQGIMNAYLEKSGHTNRRYIDLFEPVVLDDKNVLLAATLWTDMNSDNPLTHLHVSGGMNDFVVIGNGGSKIFTTQDAMKIFHDTIAYFKHMYTQWPGMNFVVMTHHAPSFESNHFPRRVDLISGGYCSNLENFILQHDKIKLWIHGHTHRNVDYKIGDCRIVSHQRGYSRRNSVYGDNCYDEFDISKTVTEI